MDFFPVLPVLSSSFLVGRVDSGDHKLSLMWSLRSTTLESVWLNLNLISKSPVWLCATSLVWALVSSLVKPGNSAT